MRNSHQLVLATSSHLHDRPMQNFLLASLQRRPCLTVSASFTRPSTGLTLPALFCGTRPFASESMQQNSNANQPSREDIEADDKERINRCREVLRFVTLDPSVHSVTIWDQARRFYPESWKPNQHFTPMGPPALDKGV